MPIQNRLFRIQGARVVSTEPLVIRIPADTGVSLRLDGTDVGPYASAGDVHLVVDAGAGSAIVGPLPQQKDEFGPPFTDFVFFGDATATVAGAFLEIRSGGIPYLTQGEGILPVSLATLRDSSVLEWIAEEGIDPHKP